MEHLTFGAAVSACVLSFSCAQGVADSDTQQGQLTGAPAQSATDAATFATGSNDPVAERVVPGDQVPITRNGDPPDASPPAEAAVTRDALFAFTVSNVNPAAFDLAEAPVANLNCGNSQIDTSNGVSFDNWCGEPPPVTIQQQTAGPELAVIALGALSLEAQSTLRVTGTRPLLLIVRDVVDIAGTIDVSARGATPGAGGDVLCSQSLGGEGLGRARRYGGGGGGGGFGSAGGRGGDDDDDEAVGGSPGNTRGNAELSPLLGGCAGGRAGGCAGIPGAGGGALQISAGQTLGVTGRIAANGAAGVDACANDAGGTGGGSGGAILLEAQNLDVSEALLEAAGGAGGAGRRQAEGGPGAASAQGVGADGESGNGSGAGGGGGGFGRIRLHGELACTGC